MMSACGFTYALEALRVQAQWAVDELLRKTADCQHALEAFDLQVVQLEASRDAAAKDGQVQRLSSLDPQRSHQRLVYLAHLAGRIAEVEQERSQACSRLEALQHELWSAQLRLDGFDRDRQDRLDEHRAEAARRQVIAADEDWLLRSAWRRGQGERLAEVERNSP